MQNDVIETEKHLAWVAGELAKPLNRDTLRFHQLTGWACEHGACRGCAQFVAMSLIEQEKGRKLDVSQVLCKQHRDTCLPKLRDPVVLATIPQRTPHGK